MEFGTGNVGIDEQRDAPHPRAVELAHTTCKMIQLKYIERIILMVHCHIVCNLQFN